VKARRVKGLDPAEPLADNAERIVRTRLDELCSFVPDAFEPGMAECQHDMRIAAKRLRYLLEVTESCFGPYARHARKRVKSLQEVLGDVHDCDELLGRAVHEPGATALVERLGALRARRHAEFIALWRELEREAFAARLRAAVAERSSSVSAGR
jgi:CHAD domain-containing protein